MSSRPCLFMAAAVVMSTMAVGSAHAGQRTATLGVSVEVVSACAASLGSASGAVALDAGCPAASRSVGPAMAISVPVPAAAPGPATTTPLVDVAPAATTDRVRYVTLTY